MGRIWTIPNIISMARLLGVPVFLWLVLGPRSATADWWAVGLLIASGASDWLDGKIARALNQQSRLGQLLDPAADRLYIVATIVALAVRGIIPWWLVVVLAAREVVLGVRAAAAAPARLGRAAGELRGQGRDAVPAVRVPAAVPGRARDQLRRDGPGRRWAFAIWGSALYWCAGLLYIVQARALLAAGPPGNDAGGPATAATETKGALRSGEGSGDGGRRGDPAAPDDRQPAQADAAGGQPADHGARAAAAAPARLRRDRRHRPVPGLAGAQLLRRRRGLRHEPPVRHRGDAAGHGRQREERRGRAARRAVPGHLRRRADRHRPVRAGRLPQGQRRAGHGGADPGARPAGVRHRHRRRGRPDPALPGEADLGPGLLRHRQHRHLRHGARGARRGPGGRGRWTGPATCSRGCWSAARRCTAGSPTATGRTSAPTRATCGPRPTCCPGRCGPTSTASRCRRASGSPRAPRSTRTRC